MAEEYILYPKTTMFLLENFMMSEVRGRIPELDEIVEDFQIKARKAIEQSRDQDEMTFNVRTGNFSAKNPFWNSIIVRVRIYKGKSIRAVGQVGTKTKLENTGLKRLLIQLTAEWDGTSISSIVDALGEDFTHEITHAYDQYSRLKTGAKSLDDPEFQARYGASRKTGEENPAVYILKSITYFASKVEQNAFVAELYQNAKRLVRNKNVSNADELFKLLLSNETQAGRSYQACKQMMDRGWNRPGFWRNLDEEEALYGSDIPYEDELMTTYSEIFGKKAQSVGDVKIKLQDIWNRFEKTFKTKVGKVAYDAWMEM